MSDNYRVVGDPEILPEGSIEVQITPKGMHALVEHQARELNTLRSRVTELERELAEYRRRDESGMSWE